LLINDLHALVQHWQNSLHQVLIIRQLLKGLPFILQSWLFILVILCETSLNPFDLLVSTLFGKLNLFNEILWLKNSSVWLNLDNVLSNELVVADELFGHNISYINDAVFILVSLIIKENVLSVIVSLINQKKLSNFSVTVICFVALEIILDGHGAELFESFKHSLILLDRIGNYVDVLILVSKFVVNHFVQLIEVIGMASGDSLKKFGIFYFV